jgi:hypothetical protein
MKSIILFKYVAPALLVVAVFSSIVFTGCNSESGDSGEDAPLALQKSSFNIFADSLSSAIEHYRASMITTAEIYHFGSANFQLPYCDLFLTYSVSELKRFDELVKSLLDRRRSLIADIQSLEISLFTTREATSQPSLMPQRETSPIIGRELDIDHLIVEQLTRPNLLFEAAADYNLDRIERMKLYLEAATDPIESEGQAITAQEIETIIAFISSIGGVTSIAEFIKGATQDQMSELADELTNIESYLGEPGEYDAWGESYSDFVRRKLYKLFEGAGQVAGSEIFAFLDDDQKGPKFEKLYGSSVTCSAGYYDYRSEVVSLDLLGFVEVRIPQGLSSGTADPIGILVPYRGGEYDESKPILLLDTTFEETTVVLKSNRVPQGAYRLVYAGGGIRPRVFEPIQIESNESVLIEPVAEKYRMRAPSVMDEGAPYVGNVRTFTVELPSVFNSDYQAFWSFSPRETGSIGYSNNVARFRTGMPGVYFVYGWFKDVNGETAYVSFSYESLLDNKSYRDTIEVYEENEPPQIEGEWEFSFTTQIGEAGTIGNVSVSTINFRQSNDAIEMSDEFGKYDGDITGTKEFFSASFEMRPDLGSCQPYFQRVLSGYISADGNILSGRAASVPIEMVGDCSGLSIGEDVTAFVATRNEFLSE